MTSNQHPQNNLLSRIEPILWIIVITLGLASAILLVIRFLMPLPSANNTVNNLATQSIQAVSNNEPKSTQPVDGTANNHSTPTLLSETPSINKPSSTPSIDDTENSKPTPTISSGSIANNQPISSEPMWWWDDYFFYRQPLTLSAVSTITYDPAITQVVKLVLFTTKDTQNIFTEGKAYPEGKDLRVVYWDGSNWTNLPLDVQVDWEPDKALTTTVSFPLRSVITETTSGYWLYYGNAVPGPTSIFVEDYTYATEPYTKIKGRESEEEIFVDFQAEPVSGLAPLAITLTNLSFTEGDKYQWDFGDGTNSPPLTDWSQEGRIISHTYTQTGIYSPTLTVTYTYTNGEPLIATTGYPGLIWVAGLDVSDNVSVNLSGSEETPVVTATLSANPNTTHVITSAEGILTVTFPPSALKEALVVSYVPYRATHDQGGGSLARFSVMAETLNGKLVTQPDQPMTLTLDVNRFFDLSDAKAKAMAKTIMFFGWEEASEKWEPLVPVKFDLEQGVIAFQLDRFDRPVQIFVTAMPGGPPPIH